MAEPSDTKNVQFGPRSMELINDVNRINNFFKVAQFGGGMANFGSIFTQPDKLGVGTAYNFSTKDWQEFGDTISNLESGRRNQIINKIVYDYGGGGYTQEEVDFWNNFTEALRPGTYNQAKPELEATIERHEPQRQSGPTSSINGTEVSNLKDTLYAGLSGKLEQAGAANFKESMIAATTLACVEKGLTSENIDRMGINTETNTIFASDQWGTKTASVDAIAAANVNPQETLQAAQQLHETNLQQQQSNQLVQEQTRSMSMA